MTNTHHRLLDHPIDAVRPWVARAWSGTDQDVFPRDRIPTWRKNPHGVAASELLPGSTKLGHGPFAFTLTQWDGSRWRVEVAGGLIWHGFDLEARGGKTLITHTLGGDLGLGFRAFVLPIHDWAVESLFDRLEAALATGSVPRTTARRMELRAAAVFRVMRLVRHRPRASAVAS